MYMGGLYNYCIVICFAVLTNFHSVPLFPKFESWAFNGDYSGVQGLSFRTCARNLPSAGFAILSAFYLINLNIGNLVRPMQAIIRPK